MSEENERSKRINEAMRQLAAVGPRPLQEMDEASQAVAMVGLSALLDGLHEHAMQALPEDDDGHLDDFARGAHEFINHLILRAEGRTREDCAVDFAVIAFVENEELGTCAIASAVPAEVLLHRMSGALEQIARRADREAADRAKG